MLTVRLDESVSGAIERAARRQKISRTALVRLAVERYIEDLEDLRDAAATLKKGARPVPLADVKARLGL